MLISFWCLCDKVDLVEIYGVFVWKVVFVGGLLDEGIVVDFGVCFVVRKKVVFFVWYCKSFFIIFVIFY